MRLFAKMFSGVALVCTLAASGTAAQAQNWGGLYIGANAGWVGADYTSVFPAVPTERLSGSHDAAILGGHVGIQHQMGQIVLGIEAAYSGTGAWSGWGSRTFNKTPGCFASDTTAGTAFCQARFDSLFTIGPRIGFAPNNQWLLYVTGGFASARLDDLAGLTSTGAILRQSSARHDGWFLGGGVEYAMTSNWIAGLEYQHVDLRTQRHCEAGPVIQGCDVTTARGRDADADADIVRARISYKLGRPAPVAEPMK